MPSLDDSSERNKNVSLFSEICEVSIAAIFYHFYEGLELYTTVLHSQKIRYYTKTNGRENTEIL